MGVRGSASQNDEKRRVFSEIAAGLRISAAGVKQKPPVTLLAGVAPRAFIGLSTKQRLIRSRPSLLSTGEVDCERDLTCEP